MEELAPGGPGVTRRRLFGQPAVFVNGNLFLGTFGEHVFVRLAGPDRARARSEGGMRPFEPMPGRAMAEYFVLPDTLLNDRRNASEWVRRGLAYVRTLPPKGPPASPGGRGRRSASPRAR